MRCWFSPTSSPLSCIRTESFFPLWWLFPLWSKKHALSFLGTWRVLGIHAQTLPFSHTCLHLADELQINVLCINSSKAFTLAGRHISRPENGSIPVLSQPPGLVSVVRALPNPSPQSLYSSLNPPAELALRFHSSCQKRALLVQDQLSRGAALYVPYLPSPCQALWEAGAALVSGHCALPRLLYHEDIQKGKPKLKERT